MVLYKQHGAVQTAWCCTDSMVLYKQHGAVQTLSSHYLFSQFLLTTELLSSKAQVVMLTYISEPHCSGAFQGYPYNRELFGRARSLDSIQISTVVCSSREPIKWNDVLWAEDPAATFYVLFSFSVPLCIHNLYSAAYMFALTAVQWRETKEVPLQCYWLRISRIKHGWRVIILFVPCT